MTKAVPGVRRNLLASQSDSPARQIVNFTDCDIRQVVLVGVLFNYRGGNEALELFSDPASYVQEIQGKQSFSAASAIECS